ncbi:Arginine-binding extracellular protein ArtP precursor [Rickettsiales bacterium Ac37b]|nr:Arginine-binding extracellular protein ArtP precursor [Rickettsiales bacterium Ac37b]
MIVITMLFKILLICLLPFLNSCEEKKNDIKQTLIMGTSADYKPFAFIQDNEIVGFEVDLAKALAKELNINLEIKDMDFAALIPALNSTRIDFVMASMTPSSERLKHIDFSNPYYTGFVTILTRKDNSISDLDGITQGTLGVQMGSVWETFANKKAFENPDIKVFVGNKIPQLIEELKVGRIDILILEEEQAREIVLFNPEFTYIILNKSEDSIAVAFTKGSNLVPEFNKALETLERTGELSRLRAKWLN